MRDPPAYRCEVGDVLTPTFHDDPVAVGSCRLTGKIPKPDDPVMYPMWSEPG